MPRPVILRNAFQARAHFARVAEERIEDARGRLMGDELEREIAQIREDEQQEYWAWQDMRDEFRRDGS